MKAIAFIYHITNYASKGDYSQYHRIIAVVIVKKTFKDQDKPDLGPPSYIQNLNKFLLKAFNRLSHNREVSGPLVVGFLVNLPDYYTPDVLIKSINIFVLKNKFQLLIFGQKTLILPIMLYMSTVAKYHLILCLSIIPIDACVF